MGLVQGMYAYAQNCVCVVDVYNQESEVRLGFSVSCSSIPFEPRHEISNNLTF